MNLTRLREGWLALEERGLGDEGFSTLDLEASLPVGAILQAVDSAGGRHILFPLQERPTLEDRSSAGVKILPLELAAGAAVGHYLDLRCDLPRLAELFDDVACDLIASALERPNQPAEACVAALDRWRALLRTVKPDAPSKSHIVGVLAELVFVIEVVRLDPQRRTDFWVGQEHQRHDLRRGSVALEVKGTSAAMGRVVSIHGLRQLEPPEDGKLYLGFVRLEQVPGGPVTIATLIDTLRELGVPAHQIHAGLDERGLPPGVPMDASFELSDRAVYAVGSEFPALTPALFPGAAVPPGLGDVRYSLDLDAARQDALGVEEESAVFNELATGDAG